MPVYPGTEPPVFTVACTIEAAGYLERRITLSSHTGTHVDAPAHLVDGGMTLERMPAASFFGKALCLNLTYLPGKSIGKKELMPYEKAIASVQFVLLHTGWSQHWGTPLYFLNYPVLTLDAARWLMDAGIKGVGVDAVSADDADSADFPIHTLLLQRHAVIIENLTGLEHLPENPFFFSCLPLKFEMAEGSPVRAVAVLL